MKIKIPIEPVEIMESFVEQLDEPMDIEEVDEKAISDLSGVLPGYHLFVKLKIRGKSMQMIIDTGASKTVFDSNLLEKYIEPMASEQVIQSSGVNAEIDIKLGRVRKLKIGSLKLKNYICGLTDLSHVNSFYKQITGRTIAGLLGSDFLLKYNAIIDYKKKKLILRT